MKIPSKSSFISFLGFAAPMLAFAATQLSDWLREREIDERIDKRVNEILAEKST